MSLISISEAAMQYQVADKTIRRAIAKLSATDKKKFVRTKGVKLYVSTQWLDSVYPGSNKTESSDNASRVNGSSVQSDETLALLRETVKTLQQQLAVKDEQIARYDSKLDQQQKLTAQLQQQLMIEAPKATTVNSEARRSPVKRTNKQKDTNPRPTTKKPSSKPSEPKKGLFKRFFGA